MIGIESTMSACLACHRHCLINSKFPIYSHLDLRVTRVERTKKALKRGDKEAVKADNMGRWCVIIASILDITDN